MRAIIIRNDKLICLFAFWLCTALPFWRWNTCGVFEWTHLFGRLSALAPLHFTGQHVDFDWLVDL